MNSYVYPYDDSICISSLTQEEMTTLCGWNNRNIMHGHPTVKQCPISLKISMNAVQGDWLTNMKKFYVNWHILIKYSWLMTPGHKVAKHDQKIMKTCT